MLDHRAKIKAAADLAEKQKDGAHYHRMERKNVNSIEGNVRLQSDAERRLKHQLSIKFVRGEYG